MCVKKDGGNIKARCNLSKNRNLILNAPFSVHRRGLGDGSGGSDGLRNGLTFVEVDLGGHLLLTAVGVGSLGAVARDVTGLTAAVAGLAGGVQGAAVGGGAVARDVTELAASVTLHGLRLAVAGVVVRTAALVASGLTGSAGVEATASVSEAAAAGHGTTGTESGLDSRGCGAVAGQVTRQVAVVAASTGGATAQAEGRAVSLNMANTLAVVALLRLGGAGEGAVARLVVWLLAVVAETLRRRASVRLVTELTALVARTLMG